MKSYNYYLLLALLLPTNIFADVLFEENFDTLPDWATQENPGGIASLPGSFDYGYTEELYHPANITNSVPSIFISGNNSDQIFGETGKALIVTYETKNNAEGWVSDGFLTKDIPPSNEIYVSFKIRFQPGFNAEETGGSVKLFRILSWDGTGSRSKFFQDGNYAPLYMFNWGKSDYGLRQDHAFRCDDQATTYYCTSPPLLNPPNELNNGAMSANFTSHSLSSRIPDLVNGGFLPSTGSVSHAQVYSDKWNKVEYYVKLNSSPSTQDGLFKFWLNGELLIDMNGIPWIGNNGRMNAKWNSVSFGGNGRHYWDTSNTPFNTSKERWVAFDDIIVRNSLPNQLSKPKSPSGITAN